MADSEGPFAMVAGSSLNQPLHLRSYGVFVQNFTVQWVQIAEVGFVPPNTSGSMALGGTTIAAAQFAAPPAVAQPVAVANQTCFLTYVETPLPFVAGPTQGSGLASLAQLERFAKANIPAASVANAGRLIELTDYDRSAWLQDALGVQFFSLTGEEFNVKAFGAKGDAIADDRPAIAAAIAAIPSGSTLFFPPGTYRVSSGGTECILVNKNIRIRGTTAAGTVIQCDAALGATVDVIRVAVTPSAQFMEISGFTILPAAGNPGRNGIRFDLAAGNIISNGYFHDLYVARHGSEGIAVVNSPTGGFFTSTFARCIIYNGIRLNTVGDTVTLEDCVFPQSGAFPAIRLSQTDGARLVSIVRCNSATTAGIFVEGPGSTRQLRIIDSQFELVAAYNGPGLAYIDLAGAAGSLIREVEIRGCVFQLLQPSATGNVLRLDFVLGVDIDDTQFTQDVVGGFAIVATANARRVKIGRKNNYLTSTDTVLATPFSFAAGAEVDLDAAPLAYTEIADSAQITNTAAKTAYSKTFTILANTLRVGDVIRVRARGEANNGAAGTFAWSIRAGGTDFVAISALAGGIGTSFQIEGDLIVRTTGAGGLSRPGLGGGDAGGTTALVSSLFGAVALDTTAAQVIDVTTTMSVANANNNSTLHALTVEILKGGTTS